MRARWVVFALIIVLATTVVAAVGTSASVLVGAGPSAAGDHHRSGGSDPAAFERALAVATDLADADDDRYLGWLVVGTLVALVALAPTPRWERASGDTRHAAQAAWALEGTPTRGPPRR